MSPAAHDKRAPKPCHCGYLGTPRCHCTPAAIERYTRRLSGPLLDRIDLRVPVRAVDYADLRERAPGLDTATMRAQVQAARAVQTARYGDPVLSNASLGPRAIRRHCKVDADGETLLRRAMDAGALTARGVARVLRVARTVADLAVTDDRDSTTTDPAAPIAQSHLLQALRWRTDP